MVRPKKSIGQHFLTDENIARKIVGSCTKTGNILEIGPGKGILSKYLLQNTELNPYFIETDIESVDYLKTKYPEISDRIIHADILKFPISKIFEEKPFTIIGNFPYHISSQIFFKVLEYRSQIEEVVCMIQKEVGERITSKHGNKTYGILSVLMQAYYNIEYLFTVKEGVFFPPPKVKSAVIRLKRNETYTLNCDEKLFFKLVKTAFNQRRKILRNALKTFDFEQKNDAIKFLLTKRAEQLSVNDFVVLTNAIKNPCFGSNENP